MNATVPLLIDDMILVLTVLQKYNVLVVPLANTQCLCLRSVCPHTP